MLGHAGLGLRRWVGNAVKFTTKPDAISFPPCRTLTCTSRSLAAFVSTFDGSSSLVFPDCNRASLRHHHHHGSPLMAFSRGFSTPRESPAADLDVPAESIQGEDEVLENPKPPRNSLVGVVISDKMDKSIVVKVSRLKLYLPYMVRKKAIKKIMAHDEENECGMGDTVRIKPSRPLSKRKRFVLHEVIRRNPKLTI
ncbi:30s ribosomal protein s17 [Nannochloropsis gaditana]|uniref:Small ribosomal subunit protein uS17c n=1 Tax=Nannochloropsis gaditana TaxID=72520 RepID=W7TJ52_9STRA|nr:30s ribosomal protein s17 [Nannochloropsis gaditana]